MTQVLTPPMSLADPRPTPDPCKTAPAVMQPTPRPLSQPPRGCSHSAGAPVVAVAPNRLKAEVFTMAGITQAGDLI